MIYNYKHVVIDPLVNGTAAPSRDCCRIFSKKNGAMCWICNIDAKVWVAIDPPLVIDSFQGPHS